MLKRYESHSLKHDEGGSIPSYVILMGSFYIGKWVYWYTNIGILWQRLTLIFQARGPKRSSDKFSGQKQYFFIIINTISGP